MLERWSPGYWIFRQYVKFSFWLFHRKIEVSGLENIPAGKPVIYAPNHQNALSDALSLVYTVPHQTLWLARADIFQSAFARPFLKFLKIVPVYRIRDGKETLSENDKIFGLCISVLKKNGALGLFPEAAHSGKRQMLPHKKAISRIVSLAEEQTGFSLDIQIIPVGIFYDQYHNFGRRLLVSFGKPLSALDYKAQYLQNPQPAVIALRNEIHRCILPLVVNFETRTNYEGFEAVRRICEKELGWEPGKFCSLSHRLKTGQHIARELDRIETEDPLQAGKLAESALELEKDLENLNLKSWLVDHREESYRKLIFYALILLFSFPVFAFGFVFNALPFFFLDRLIKKKVKEAVFRSTFSFAAGLILFPLVYIIECILVSFIIPGWLFKLLFLVSLPLTGKMAFSWYILWLKTRGRGRWLKIKRSEPDLYRDFHRRKQEIVSQMSFGTPSGV